MWLDTLNRAVKDISDTLTKVQYTTDIKELNKLELNLHNLFQEYYGVLGNATREVKQAIRARRIEVRKLDQINKAVEQEKALERAIEKMPEQEIVDATKLDEPKTKKTTKKKTTKKAKK